MRRPPTQTHDPTPSVCSQDDVELGVEDNFGNDFFLDMAFVDPQVFFLSLCMDTDCTGVVRRLVF